jgi:ankyrin repeat protein
MEYILEHAPLTGVMGHTLLSRLTECNKGPLILEDFILIHACAGGQTNIARRAVQNGANRLVRYKYSKDSPLVTASERGFHGIVALLLENGINGENKLLSNDMKLAIIEATKRGWVRVVKILIDKGAELNPKGNQLIPVLQAIKYGQDKALDLLLRSVAKMPEEESDRQLWYNYALSRGYSAVVTVMQEHGFWNYE